MAERHLGRVALVVRHLALRLGEGFLVAIGDLGREGSFGAARLALDEGVVGDDIGRVAGRLAVLAAENADIAGAAAVGLDHLAEPAGALRLGEGDGADHAWPRCPSRARRRHARRGP